MDLAITEELHQLATDLVPVTPLGHNRPPHLHMRDAWEVAQGDVPHEFLLMNLAVRERGKNAPYDYPTRVLDDPAWSRSYQALNDTIDAAITRMEASLDVHITKLIGR